MPRYFFHIAHADRRVEDPEGEDFDALETAEQEAAAALRDLISAALTSGTCSTLQAIDVADKEGLILATVHLTDAARPVFNCTRRVASSV